MKKFYLLGIVAALFLAPAVLAQDTTPTAPKTEVAKPAVAIPALAVEGEAPPAAELENPEVPKPPAADTVTGPVEAPAAPGLWEKISELLLGKGFDLLAYLIMALLGLISTAFGFLARWISAKTGSERAGVIAERLGVALERAVKATWQTYAEDLKKGRSDGKLTDDEKAEARKRAIDFAKSYLGPKGIRELLWVLGIDSSKLDGALGDMLEPFIAKAKEDAKAANPS